MTTSNGVRQRQRVWVVGSRGVGKKNFVTALGGSVLTSTPTTVTTVGEQVHKPFVEYAWHDATIAVCDDATQWRGECARRDVVVLLFDMTDRASFDAVVQDWAALLSAQTRTLLVATKLDRIADRAVATSEVMELALVECDDFIEVCTSRPPFQGVVYARQLLATWLSQDEPTSMPPSPSSSPSPSPSSSRAPLSSPSTKQKLGARSNVWLYDPTEELSVASGRDDVKLRPISRALFEMREAGSDRVKSQDRKREQAVAKLVGRSRYHGPTESSRSMRWQAHQLQLQQQQQNAKRRQSLSDVNVLQEHARLETKSFLQPTKLMQQRVDEIRHKLLASTEKPSRRTVKQTERRAARQRAVSTAPPAPTLAAHAMPRTRRLSLSPPHKPASHARYALQNATIAEIESDEVVLDLLSPPLAPLLVPGAMTPPRTATKKNPHHEPVDTDTQQENQRTLVSKPTSPDDTAGDRSHTRYCVTDPTELAIDEMLDYFDGVTLPL